MSRQMAADDLRLNMYNVYLYSPESATISLWQRYIGWISQIFPTPSYLAPSFGVTPFELMVKLYGS